MSPKTPNLAKNIQAAQGASILVVLAGLWFFLSPWFYGAMGQRNAWNCWIIGAIMITLAAVRSNNPLTTIELSWVNCVLAIWTFISPWIYRYTFNHGRFINSLAVGVIVFVASIVSATMVHRHPMTQDLRHRTL